MSYVTGLMLLDAPASALNNAGQHSDARTANAVAVKHIRTPEGHYPYVSAQAVRYWLRTQLEREGDWSASPVFRETKVAYTDAEPTRYAEDDLFGYMRATSKSADEKKAAKRAEIAARSTPVEGEVTRIAPLRVGTLVALAPARIVSDFGTMARAEGDPVPHEHQFYRAHLKAGLSLDLTSAGTFFISQRVGYKNLDARRQELARAAGAQAVKVRGFDALRLPLAERQRRVARLVETLGRLEGGAKQTLHLTDTAPAVLVLAVCRSAAQPFQRLMMADELGATVLRADVLAEALRVYRDDLLSPVYIGWARGFLDQERSQLEAALAERDLPITHPREAAQALAHALRDEAHAHWFD
jgi:CRISPR-associated protein Cst2